MQWDAMGRNRDQEIDFSKSNRIRTIASSSSPFYNSNSENSAETNVKIEMISRRCRRSLPRSLARLLDQAQCQLNVLLFGGKERSEKKQEKQEGEREGSISYNY